MVIVLLQIFTAKKCQKKKHHENVSIIMLDSVIKAKKKCYPQTFLEECKYEHKKSKMEKFLDDDLEKSDCDESDGDFDNDFNDK